MLAVLKRHNAQQQMAAMEREIMALIDADPGLAGCFDSLVSIPWTPRPQHQGAARPAWLPSQSGTTPASASWINQVERWFAELTRKQLRRGVHTSTSQLEQDIRSFIERHNENPKPYRWTMSADEILASAKRFAERLPNVAYEANFT